jgi:hypothetical protein
MSQYYYTDGKERYGPFTLEQLKEKNIGGDTLVWKEGMADWQPANSLPDFQTISPPVSTLQPPPAMPYSAPFPTAAPKNWLVESILVTLLCCLPLGIVGIINATKVEALWNSGQRDLALKASQDAGKWVKIAFITGLVIYGLYFLVVIFGLAAGFGFGGGLPQ